MASSRVRPLRNRVDGTSALSASTDAAALHAEPVVQLGERRVGGGGTFHDVEEPGGALVGGPEHRGGRLAARPEVVVVGDGDRVGGPVHAAARIAGAGEVHGALEDAGLALEGGVDALRRHIGGRGDLIDRGGAVALLEEQLGGGFEHALLARLGLGPPPARVVRRREEVLDGRSEDFIGSTLSNRSNSNQLSVGDEHAMTATTRRTTLVTDVPEFLDGIVLVHDAIRRDVARLPEAIDASSTTTVPGRSCAGSPSSSARSEHHHHREDDVVWPMLLERAPEFACSLNVLETDHWVLDRAMSSARAAVGALTGGDLELARPGRRAVGHRPARPRPRTPGS